MINSLKETSQSTCSSLEMINRCAYFVVCLGRKEEKKRRKRGRVTGRADEFYFNEFHWLVESIRSAQSIVIGIDDAWQETNIKWNFVNVNLSVAPSGQSSTISFDLSQSSLNRNETIFFEINFFTLDENFF